MSNFQLDNKGHSFSFYGNTKFVEVIENALMFAPSRFSPVTKNDDYERFEQAVEKGNLDGEAINVKVEFNSSLCCDYCEDRNFIVEGNTIKAEKACAYPQGRVFEAYLNVPSGKIAVANNFHSLFKEKVKDITSVGVPESVWASQWMEEYAKNDLLTFFVSNTSPEVFKDVTKQNKFNIATPDVDWEWTEEGDKLEVHPQFGKSLGHVWTDLWWVSMMDFDNFKSFEYDGEYFIIETTPGLYKLSHQFFDKTSHEDLYGTLTLVE